MKSKLCAALLSLGMIICFSSCGQQKTEWKGTIEEVNGIMVVKNPKEPVYSEDLCVVEEELSIGEAEGDEQGYQHIKRYKLTWKI